MTTTPTSAMDGAAVRLTGLHKKFGQVHAVRGVDLLIVPGEVVAFLGPNGAGKSTTIDMLLGLTRPDAGSVRLFGTDPVAAVQAGRVGAMLQAGALLPDVTVRELVTMFAGLHRHPMPVATAMELAGVTDIAGQKTQKLSGGEAQRVRFALGLVPDPDLLVLDEPTAAMDVEVRRSFWASMREFTGTGRTVLFATHYLEEADHFADRVVVLAGGVVVADGTGAQIKATVAGRTISAVIDDASTGDLARLPGVVGADRQATRSLLHCNDSDAALRALLAQYPQAHDIEIATGNLEDAFLELVAASRQETTR
jgi:ABC-2 type transport system ATP-binding protein